MSVPVHESLAVRLVEIRWAAKDINLYTFEPVDGGMMPAGEAGAHIGLLLANGLERQYSLVTPSAGERYTVGIKRDAAGRGGSRYVHDELRAGAEIRITPPRNNFPLREDAGHSVFFAGGIGITPINAMIERLESLGRRWTLHYCARARDEMALAGAFAGRGNAHLHVDLEAGGLLPIADLVAANADAELYCCGPTPMLAAFEAACAGLPPERVHVEYFGQKYEADTSGGYEVELARSGAVHVVPAGRTILQVLRAHGLEVPSSCEEGVCGACETAVLSGTPDHRDAILTERERKAGATMMICCSGSLGGRLVLDL